MATEIKHDWWILSGIVSADVLASEHLWYCYHILALARTDPGSPGLAGVPGVSWSHWSPRLWPYLRSWVAIKAKHHINSHQYIRQIGDY